MKRKYTHNAHNENNYNSVNSNSLQDEKPKEFVINDKKRPRAPDTDSTDSEGPRSKTSKSSDSEGNSDREAAANNMEDISDSDSDYTGASSEEDNAGSLAYSIDCSITPDPSIASVEMSTGSSIGSLGFNLDGLSMSGGNEHNATNGRFVSSRAHFISIEDDLIVGLTAEFLTEGNSY